MDTLALRTPVGRALYWNVGLLLTLWTDSLVHRIHLRVLEHVKHLSEEPPLPSGNAQN